jgi:hypothetical protein
MDSLREYCYKPSQRTGNRLVRDKSDSSLRTWCVRERTQPNSNSKGVRTRAKWLFVWDYNLPRLYNPIIFELRVSSKVVGLYNLGRL